MFYSVVRESCTFPGHLYIWRIARLPLRQHGFLVLCCSCSDVFIYAINDDDDDDDDDDVV